MKQVIYGIVVMMLIFLTAGILIAVMGKMNRQVEIDNGLSKAVEDAVESTMNQKRYQIVEDEEFLADFTQNLLLQISNDSDIEIQVMGVDAKKGLLSVRVIENFVHPNGKKGKNTIETTVVFEKVPAKTKMVTITYMLDEETLYKEYQIALGDKIIVPHFPQIEGKTFKGWQNSESRDVVKDFGAAKEDATYMAIFGNI